MSPVESRVDLTPFNTLGLPSETRYFVRLEAPEELAALRADPRLAGVPWHVLGGGSNLWLPEKLDALVIKVEIPGRHLLSETDEAVYVSAGGGENWDEFVHWTLQQGWAGLENLALIPGTVGAAPVQNIGAYGVEVKDCLHDLTAYHLRTGERRVFSHADCQFAYRDSIFKHEEAGQWLIASVTFRLPKHRQPVTAYGEIGKELAAAGLPATPQGIAQAVSTVRRRKLPDPVELGNAGSFFHNPIVEPAVRERLLAQSPDLVSYAQPDGRWKLAAGWLIERCGWKGKALGPAGMYEKQALVLVNLGGATAADITRLARAVQADVKQRFGVELVAEPVRW